MSDGFLFWYEHGWSPLHAADRIAAMEAAGLWLANPATGRIGAASADDDSLGEQIVIDRATLVRRAAVQADREFSFQYWIVPDIDTFCTIERLTPSLVVQRLYLDGLTEQQQRFVITAVFDQIRASTESTRGVIVDRTGGSANEDWDALVLGAPGRVPVRANIMGLPGAIAARHPELHDDNPGRLGDLVVYDPDKLLSTTPST